MKGFVATLATAVAALSLSPLALEGAPEEYWRHASDAVRQEHFQNRKAKQGENNVALCGTQQDPSQLMWFTQNDCSIASENVTFMFNETLVISAQKGDVIPWACESVFCPTPKVTDCYKHPEICAEDEFCLIDQHERWGPWSADQEENRTPDEGYCSQDIYRMIGENANLTSAEIQEIVATYRAQCDGVTIDPADYNAIRGQCVKYRKKDQSCLMNEIRFEDSLGYNPKLIKNEKGNVFKRPLVCDPRYYECTGPDFDVLPNTCVPKRPSDICFFGPWWNSSTCLRTEPEAPSGGINVNQAQQAAAIALMLYPGEIMSPSNCTFWDASTKIGADVAVAQQQIYSIFGALWPQHLYGVPPTFDQLLDLLPTPYKLSGGLQECYEDEDVPGSQAAVSLHELHTLAAKPNMIWSLVHMVMHNQPSAMSYKAVQASRALAIFLTEYFWCTDCRSFFAIGVVKEYGLPPMSFFPHDHAKWWWHAHNVASEHIATHRGGHPWIYQLGAEDVVEYQNPFYMSWEDAVNQWEYQE